MKNKNKNTWHLQQLAGFAEALNMLPMLVRPPLWCTRGICPKKKTSKVCAEGFDGCWKSCPCCLWASPIERWSGSWEQHHTLKNKFTLPLQQQLHMVRVQVISNEVFLNCEQSSWEMSFPYLAINASLCLNTVFTQVVTWLGQEQDSLAHSKQVTTPTLPNLSVTTNRQISSLLSATPWSDLECHPDNDLQVLDLKCSEHNVHSRCRSEL